MARKTITKYVVTSDLSGDEFTTEDEPTTFAYDGISYRIDLTPAEVEEFESLLNKYIDVAEEIPPYLAKSATSGEQAAMRQWFRDNPDKLPENVTLADRGRIPKVLKDIYNSEHKK